MGQSLAIPRVIPNDWKRLDLIVNKIKMRLGRDGSPTFTDLTLTGVLILSKICTVAAGLNVLRVTGLQTDATALTGTLRGAYIDVSNGSTEATGTIRALELKARTEAPGDTGSKVAVLEGLSISADSKAHDVTTMRAAEFILDGKTAGTIDEAVGLRIANNLQIDKAVVSYGLQIYRDSFDYTADIQLSSGGLIGGSDGTLQIALGGNITLQPTIDSTTFFQVLDADGSTPIFNVDTTNERVGVNTSTPEVRYHVVSTASGVYPMYLDSVADTPVPGIAGRSARGTPGSETATQVNDVLAIFGGRGHNGTAFESTSSAYVLLRASENFTATENGSQVDFYTTPVGSTTAIRQIQILNNGDVRIANSVGIGDSPTGGYQLHIQNTAPVFALQNTVHEDTDGGSESLIIFRGEDSGTTIRTQAQIRGEHDLTGTDGAGNLRFYTSTTGNVLTEALRIDSSQFVGINEIATVGRLSLTTSVNNQGIYLRRSSGDSGDNIGLYFKTSADTTATYWKGAILWQDDGTAGARGSLHLCVDQSSDSGNAGLTDTVIKIDSAGITHIGDGGTTNYTKFEADGTVEFNGAATVWNDANMGVAQLALPTALQPDEDEFVDEAGDDTGISTWAFAVGEKVSGSIEIPHDYKEGSDITFHVHWQGIAAPTDTDNVKWQCTYTVAQMESTLDAPATTVVEEAYDTQYEFKISSCTAITGTNFNIGDQFLFTLERVVAVGDAYAGDALVATVGLHYECDTVGSRQMLTKL